MKALIPLLFISFIANATVTPLPNLKGRYSLFQTTDVFIRATNNDTINLAFANRYDSVTNQPLDVQIARVNVTTHTTTYKTVTGVPSYKAGFTWKYVMTSDNTIYYSVGYIGTLLQINLNDSIYVVNRGNPFTNNHYIYSLSLGANGHPFIGAMDYGTQVAEVNSNSFTTYDALDGQQYVMDLSQLGGYIYAYTGQSPFVLWALNRTTGAKTELIRTRSDLRMTFYNTGTNLYVNYLDSATKTFYHWHELSNGGITPIATPNTDPVRIGYSPLLHMYAAYQKSNNKLYISKDDLVTNSPYDIVSGFSDNTIRKFWTFGSDTTNIYFQGDTYDDIYEYNKSTGVTTDLVNTTYNIHSVYPLNDSIAILGSYPNSTLLFFNKNTVHFDTTFETRSITGVHEPRQMIRIGNKLVVAGSVIRIATSCGIGAIDLTTKQTQGIDYNFFGSLTYSGLSQWRDKAILSTSGTNCALYVYDPQSNIITDSFRITGFGNYGSIQVQGNVLVGITQSTIYRYDLNTRKLISQVALNANINNLYFCSNGQILLQTQATNVPDEYKVLNYDLFYEKNGVILGRDGINIYQITGVTDTRINYFNTQGRVYNVSKLLGL